MSTESRFRKMIQVLKDIPAQDQDVNSFDEDVKAFGEDGERVISVRAEVEDLRKGPTITFESREGNVKRAFDADAEGNEVLFAIYDTDYLRMCRTIDAIRHALTASGVVKRQPTLHVDGFNDRLESRYAQFTAMLSP